MNILVFLWSDEETFYLLLKVTQITKSKALVTHNPLYSRRLPRTPKDKGWVNYYHRE